MKRIVFILWLLFSGATMQSVYNVGTIDSIAGTNNGGTGYGNATQADATGYVTAGFSTNSSIYGSAMQPDGKAVVVGADTNLGDALVARYTINGTEDTTFNPGTGFYIRTKFGQTSAQARAVTVLPNGKIIVVGSVVVTVGTRTAFFVAQFLPDGSLDTTGFAGGQGYTAQNLTESSSDLANSVTVDSSGYLYVVGTSTQSSSNNIFAARYTSAGVLDTTYNSFSTSSGGGSGSTIPGIAVITLSSTLVGNGCVLDTNDNLLVAGSALADLIIARLTGGSGSSSGVLDTTFNTSGYNTLDTNGNDVAYAVGLQSTGKIIVAGTDATNALVARFTTAGLLDSGTGGFGSGVNPIGYIRETFGGNPSYAYGLAIQSDNKIVVGGTTSISANQNFVIARFLADGSDLDSSFSSDGYTTTYVASLDNGNSLSMQQNGSCILAGDYTNSNPNISFLTARYLGDIPQGCMDYTYNPAVATSPGAPGYRTYPTDATSTDVPKVVAMYPCFGDNVYVLTSKATPTVSTQLVQLNSSGVTSAGLVAIAQPTPTDVIADSQGRAVAVGTGTNNGWLARYYNNAGTMTIDPNFNNGSIIVATNYASSFQRVVEQKSGRIIAIGQMDGTTGIVIAYTESGDLDLSFGFQGSGYNSESGSNNGATINDMIIDANDGIYIVYQVAGGSQPNIFIEKFLANGSGLDGGSFATNTAGQVNTNLASANYTTPCLSFDNNGNIVVMTTNNSTGAIVVQSYAPVSTAAPIVNSCSISTTTTLLSNPIITKLQCDTNNQLIFTGYDANDFFVGRLVLSGSTYILDTTFAPYSSCPGILKTMYSTNNPSRVSNSVCINSNGAILFGGYENINSLNTTSVVGQVVGNTGGTIYTQVPRFPGASLVGTLDTSFGSNGGLDLMTAPASLPNGQAKVMNVLATNKILIADADGTNTVLARLTSAYGADTSFSTDGLVTLTGLVTPTAIMVDTTAANYYVLGINSTPRGVIHKVIASDGSLAGGVFPVTTTLTFAYGIAQQASGRILVAGYDSAHSGGSGVIAAYTPAGALDTSFNPSSSTPGYWYTGVASLIMSISIGTIATQVDRIYIAYSDGAAAGLGNAVVQQLLENGTSYAPTTGTGAFSHIINGFSTTVNGNTQLRMQLDVNGKIVLGAATASTYGTTPAIKAARYPAAGGTVDVGPVSVLAGATNQGIENMITLSNGTTLIVAAIPNATAASAFLSVAQLDVACTLDQTFNLGDTPGYLTTNVPSSSSVMTDFYAIDVISTGGILVSGDNSQTAASADPYLTKIIATATPTKVSQSATSLGAAGSLDTTFNPAGINPGCMNLTTELQTTDFLSTTVVRALLQNSDGSYFIAGSTTTNSYVTLMSDDDVQDATFGSITIQGSGKTNVTSMLLSQTGTLLVAGEGEGTAGSGWLANLDATTGEQIFTATTNLSSHYAIAQQTNGRILVAGVVGTVGAIIAYNSFTGAVDTTFGVNGIYTASGYSGINSMIVDALNNIYFIANDDNNNANIIKIVQSGSGPAAGWTIPTVTSNSTVPGNNHLRFNQAGQIVAVAVDRSETAKIVINYITASSGAVATLLNLPNSGGTPTGITTPHVKTLLVDRNTSSGKVVLTGYDSSTSPNTPFILRTNTALTALDTTFNITGVQEYNTVSGGVITRWYAAMINANGKITVGGYASELTTPYTMRVYGDEFIGQYSPSLTPLTAGAPGTIDTTFASSGQDLLADLSGATALAGLTPQVVVSTSSGQYYMALLGATPATDPSQVIRLTNAAVLDTSYNTTGFAAATTAGLYSMIMDAAGDLVLGGTTGVAGWINRLTTSGVLDTTFNSNGILFVAGSGAVTNIVQQSLNRYVAAGRLINGHGALFACTNTGTADTTFSLGSTAGTGIYDTGVTTTIYAMIADEYDRLIIAYKNGSAVDLARLTSSGQLDTTFGTGGAITGAIPSLVDAVDQVFITFDVSGNIVVAAHTSTPAVAVKAYANGSGTSVVQAQLTITSLTDPIVTDLLATADGKILMSGYQSGTNPMWVARVVDNGTGTYILDMTFGGGDGIMSFSFDSGATARNLSSIAIYGNGEIAIVGTETNGTVNPFLAMAYDNPYTRQTIDFVSAQPIGSNDITFGVSTDTATARGVTFFANGTATSASSQVARAIALQDDNSMMIAVDGGASTSATPSFIYLTKFDVDGLLDTTFGSGGKVTLPLGYSSQNVQDMVTFTTAAGLHKAILAGYVTNASTGTSSLLFQYNLDGTGSLDLTFGGYDGDTQGVAFGDGKQINSVARQTTGRIIAAGQSNDDGGLLLGYTATGKLDSSFGNNGYLQVTSSTTGLFTHAIDSLNRVVIAYKLGSSNNVAVARYMADGSGLDTTFNALNLTNALSGNANIKITIDSGNNVIVGASSNNDGNELTFTRYSVTNGELLQTARIPYNSLGGLSSAKYNFGQLVVDTSGKVVVACYDESAQRIVVLRLVISSIDYILDSTFNAYNATSNPSGTPGYLLYSVAAGSTSQVVTDALIHPDGRILIVGS